MLWPEATWQPVAQHGGNLHPIAVCLHHQAGTGNPAGIYASRNVSAHFWLPRTGRPVQHVDTRVQAWHGVAHNAYSLGVETEGCATPPNADPLTEHQLDTFARLMTWANQVHGIPLVLSESVTQPGFNYHRCKGGPATGCPCQERVNARTEILRRATGGTPTGGGAVAIRATPSGHGYWVVGSDGGVFTFGDAMFLGSLGDENLAAPIVDMEPTPSGRGYWLLGADGGVFTFGDAGFYGAATGLVQ